MIKFKVQGSTKKDLFDKAAKELSRYLETEMTVVEFEDTPGYYFCGPGGPGLVADYDARPNVITAYGIQLWEATFSFKC